MTKGAEDVLMLQAVNVESPCESAASNCRLVPSSGVVLAVGDTCARTLAIAVAVVAAVSRSRDNFRRSVRIAAGHFVSAGAHFWIPWRFHQPHLLAASLDLS